MDSDTYYLHGKICSIKKIHSNVYFIQMNTMNTKSSKYLTKKMVNIELYDEWKCASDLKVGKYGLCEVKESTIQCKNGKKFKLHFVHKVKVSNYLKCAIKFAKLYKQLRYKRMVEYIMHPSNIDFSNFESLDRLKFI